MSGPFRLNLPDDLSPLLDLMQAADALTEESVTYRTETAWVGTHSRARRVGYCSKCFRAGVAGREIEHAASCAVGSLVRAVATVRRCVRIEPTFRPVFSETELSALHVMANAPGVTPDERTIEYFDAEREG